MNSGFPGSFSRSGDYVVEARCVDPQNGSPVFFGDAIFQYSFAPFYGSGTYRSAQALSASFSGISTASSNVITSVTSTATLFNGAPVQVGMGVVGPNISYGSQVASFTSNTITLTTAATSSASTIFNVLSPVLGTGGFCGVAVREVQTSRSYSSQATVSYYSAGSQCDVLMRGSVSVLVTQPTGIAPFGQVWLRIAENPSLSYLPVGGFEASADGNYTLALPNTQFTTGTIDNDGVAEISILTRNCA